MFKNFSSIKKIYSDIKDINLDTECEFSKTLALSLTLLLVPILLFFFFCFLGPNSRHVEFPRLGVKSEL